MEPPVLAVQSTGAPATEEATVQSPPHLPTTDHAPTASPVSLLMVTYPDQCHLIAVSLLPVRLAAELGIPLRSSRFADTEEAEEAKKSSAMDQGTPSLALRPLLGLQVKHSLRLTPRWLVSLCFLATIISGVKPFTTLTREELYQKIANKDVLGKGQLEQLLNVPRGGVSPELLAKDCRGAFLNGRRKSGLYVIQPKHSVPMVVYCNLAVEGGGWTVIQRNTKSSGVFGSSTWSMYKNGFGNPMGNHWLGNELIYFLTRQNTFTVRFLITDAQNKEYYADYSSFRVDSEDNGYALRLGNFSGSVWDALTVMNETGTHDNMKFSTSDRDNDRWDKNCAKENNGGWWFDSCHSALLNSDLIYWRGLCEEANPCQSASIMIKPSRENCDQVIFPGGNGHGYPIHINS
ncbi:fibrinogen-like protein 1-like protein [Discoglossus pictus]